MARLAPASGLVQKHAMHWFPRPPLTLFGFILLLPLAPIQAAEEGFVDLFDGHSLKGWRFVGAAGKEDSFVAQDGRIVCRTGGRGNLFTEAEYGDFIFRFEFRLTPGANNGIGIRAPLDGNPAYAGMEIQVLDHFHPKYADLQPWQFHGSVYGVVPAKQEGLRPAGEWNSEEIACIGSRVTVRLNGVTIVDADLNEVTDPKVLEKVPGIRRTTGHLALLGHDDYVEFRNLRIRDLGGSERKKH